MNFDDQIEKQRDVNFLDKLISQHNKQSGCGSQYSNWNDGQSCNFNQQASSEGSSWMNQQIDDDENQLDKVNDDAPVQLPQDIEVDLSKKKEDTEKISQLEAVELSDWDEDSENEQTDKQQSK